MLNFLNIRVRISFDIFNIIYQKNEFDYFLNYILKLIILYAIQYKRIQKLNIN